MPDPRPVAITLGDAAGIGPEIIAKAFAHPSAASGCVVFGDARIMQHALHLLKLEPKLSVAVISDLTQAMNLPAGVIPVWQVGTEIDPPPWGQVSAATGR